MKAKLNFILSLSFILGILITVKSSYALSISIMDLKMVPITASTLTLAYENGTVYQSATNVSSLDVGDVTGKY